MYFNLIFLQGYLTLNDYNEESELYRVRIPSSEIMKVFKENYFNTMMNL